MVFELEDSLGPFTFFKTISPVGIITFHCWNIRNFNGDNKNNGEIELSILSNEISDVSVPFIKGVPR